MKLEDKYPTLEQSKRIAKLLVEGASESSCHYAVDVDGIWKVMPIVFKPPYSFERYPAYDLAEMGQMILQYKRGPALLKQMSYATNLGGIGVWEYYSTEAQARAALLIFLLEHGDETTNDKKRMETVPFRRTTSTLREGIVLDVWHNIPSHDSKRDCDAYDDVIDEWISKTESLTPESFCQYVNSDENKPYMVYTHAQWITKVVLVV